MQENFTQQFCTSVHSEQDSLWAQVLSQGWCGARAVWVPPLRAERWSAWSMGGALGTPFSKGTTTPIFPRSPVVDEGEGDVLLRAGLHIISTQSQWWWARQSGQVLRDLQWNLRLSSHPSALATPCITIENNSKQSHFYKEHRAKYFHTTFLYNKKESLLHNTPWLPA